MLSFDISQGANVNIAIVLIMYWSNIHWCILILQIHALRETIKDVELL